MEVQNPAALWPLLLVLFVLPAAIAVMRRHPSAAPIVALDLVAGWTVVGWIAALVWALWPITPTTRLVQQAAAAAAARRPRSAGGGRRRRRRLHGRRGDTS